MHSKRTSSSTLCGRQWCPESLHEAKWVKSPSTLLQTFPRLAGFRDWIWHVATACFRPALSKIAREPVVRSVICMLNAAFSRRVFFSRMLDQRCKY